MIGPHCLDRRKFLVTAGVVAASLADLLKESHH
ncbi:twin-arginine translocation signal domain-containing protein [Mycobacterium sp. CBMA293]|nr:twin-arginine translocation signal domain-containing protein [Mycolicibacterium sp. CBMA 360]MUL56756.1 twin-arginine translocation signal domain-containing protein [Mycolicibacterium sp. CBMA 335]MUL69795.1 twin-arginine translocation signal domain-containing protein [Mycolicibacterium sp. CBMA 311]MUL91843.1 twin-arginine translocation signal domain-containing protein [Mycolicibacterium sp. CBMA 230]MUM10699.1 twin-arginine translocation signal domain-containing protein [Mycolicibacterium 